MEVQTRKSEFPPDTNGGDVWLTNSSITIDFIGSALPHSFADLAFPWKPFLLRAWESRSLLWEVVKLEGEALMFLEFDPETGDTKYRKALDNPFVNSYLEYRKKHWGKLHGN